MKQNAHYRNHSKSETQGNCPPKKASHKPQEISLETLEILLTSVPEEEINLTATTGPHADDRHALYKRQLKKVLAHKQHYLKRITNLKQRKRGAEWLHQNLAYFQSKFPWELVSLLENMAHEQVPDISCQTLKPINEIQTTAEPALSNTNIEGLSIFTTNIRRLIFNSLESPLEKLDSSTPETATNDELKVWYDWCINIESHFQKIEELITEGQSFFSLKNFRKLTQLQLSDQSLEQVNYYLQRFEQRPPDHIA